MTGTWQIWALLSAVFAATTAILAKVGVQGVDPNFATLIRTAVVLPALGAVILATGHWQPPQSVDGRTWVFLALSGLATGASWLCYFNALKLGDASAVASLDKLSVVLVAVFAAAFLGERLSLSNWFGILLIVGGAVLVARRA